MSRRSTALHTKFVLASAKVIDWIHTSHVWSLHTSPIVLSRVHFNICAMWVFWEFSKSSGSSSFWLHSSFLSLSLFSHILLQAAEKSQAALRILCLELFPAKYPSYHLQILLSTQQQNTVQPTLYLKFITKIIPPPVFIISESSPKWPLMSIFLSTLSSGQSRILSIMHFKTLPAYTHYPTPKTLTHFRYLLQ